MPPSSTAWASCSPRRPPSPRSRRPSAGSGWPLPPGWAEFYRLGDGAWAATNRWAWNFDPLERLAKSSDLAPAEPTFTPNEGTRLPTPSLVRFCDVLISAPDYAFVCDPAHADFGLVVAAQGGEGWRVAASFAEFVAVFVAESDLCLLNCH